MSKAPPKRPATYQDIVELPEHLIGEIIDDELVVSPRPALEHSAVTMTLSVKLGGNFGGDGPNGGWVFLFEPELHLVGQVMVPDVAGWRRDRMPGNPKGPFSELAPDWLCEVLSPGTAARDRTSKMRHCGRAGVRYVWLIDPAVETLEVFRLDGKTWSLVLSGASDDRVRAEPFEAIELDLAPLWAR